MKLLSEFVKGLWRENPTFRIALGLCPTLAVSTSVSNGIGMGMAATFVLIGSNIFISLVRKYNKINLNILLINRKNFINAYLK